MSSVEPVESDDVDPASTNDPVDSKCCLGSLRCHICSSPRCVGADDERFPLDLLANRNPEPGTLVPKLGGDKHVCGFDSFFKSSCIVTEFVGPGESDERELQLFGESWKPDFEELGRLIGLVFTT